MSIDTLLQELKSPNERIRLRAMFQLGILGDPAALPALQDIHQNDPIPDLKNVARAAAQHIQETKAVDRVRDAALDVTWTQQFLRFVDGTGIFMTLDVSDLTDGITAQAADILRQAGESVPQVQSPSPASVNSASSANSLAGAMQQVGQPSANISPMQALSKTLQSAASLERTHQGTDGTRIETTGVFEMLWDCEFCGSKKLLGVTHRFCPNCGSPQNADKRYFPKPGEEIALENHIYHGVDWICPSCSQPNSANANFCGSCGTDKTGAKASNLREDPGKAAPSASEGRGVVDGFQARDLTQERFDADMQRIQQAEKLAARNRPVFWGLRRKELGIIGIIAFLMTSIVAGVFAFTYKKSEDLVVAEHQWERIIHLEEFKEVSETQDCIYIPNDARVTRRFNETRTRRVPDGETCREECTTQRVDQGDGSFRSERVCRDVCTTKYRDETYTIEVCAYTVDRWKDGRDVKASGKGTSPAPEWPEYTLASGSGSRHLGQEREDEREENYVLVLERKDGEEAKCEYDEMSIWNRFTDGEAVRMSFNILGKPVCDTLSSK